MSGHRHGSWGGHVLPGVLFLVLGLWWLLASAAAYHQKRRAPFRPQPWWPFTPAGATQYKRLVMLEPLLLTALPLAGVFVELYFHPGDLWFRAAVTQDGERFEPDNLNNCASMRRHASVTCSLTRSSVQGSTRRCTRRSLSVALARSLSRSRLLAPWALRRWRRRTLLSYCCSGSTCGCRLG